mgnify:CR=1 FL=1
MALTKIIGDGLATSGLPTGTVIQVVNVQDGAVANTTANITNVLFLSDSIEAKKSIIVHSLSAIFPASC